MKQNCSIKTIMKRSPQKKFAKTINRLIALLILLACVNILHAQNNNTIKGIAKGQVIDSATGQPIEGVTITIKGSKRGTTTDKQGNFTLESPAASNELVIKYVGYNDAQVLTTGANPIRIQLVPAANNLNQVVVVGYGTQRRAKVTGAISTITDKEIMTTKNENVMNMLTGKIPGLRMVQRTAEPGAYENTFDIRGYGAPPLIVIDNVPRSAGELSRMDPNEIENISVLKDAAAAVYGVRAANGVILVTTKKGSSKEGKFDIGYSFNQAWQQFLGMPDAVGPVDYMMLTNEKAKRDFDNNFRGNAAPPYSYENMQPWMTGEYKGADWIDAAFNTVAPQQQHNLSISGGTERISTYINFGYMKQDGLLKSGDMDYSRWNLRSNINVKITDRLRAQVLLSGFSDKKNQPFQDLWTIFKYTWNQIPINQIYANNNPEYLNVMPDNANPVAITDADKVGYKTYTQKNMQSQVNLEYDIPGVKGLRARGMFNYGYVVNDNTEYRKIYNLYSYNAVDSTYIPSQVNGLNGKSNLYRGYFNNNATISQLSLNYANSFGDHNVTGMFLYEQSHSKADNIYASRYVLLPVDYLFGGETTDQTGNTAPNGVTEIATRAYVGRVTYDYKGKYLAEFSFRNDGSNKYKPGANQWGFFPAYFVGYRISEEPFFKRLVPANIVTSLKLRASYGELGYDGGTAFQYLSGYDYPTVDPADNLTWGYMFDGQFVAGAATRGLVNENLTWYTSTAKNIGIDFSLFKGKLDGTFEVYRRDQEGLPATRQVSIPGTAGVDLPDENLNSDRTQGWEASLNYKGRIGREWTFNVGGNIFYARSMNQDVIEGMQGNAFLQWRNGQGNRYKNIWWGIDYGGQFNSYEQIYGYKTNTGNGNSTVLPGDYYFADWNEDGVINGDDYHPIATQDIPLMNFGINISVNYKGFDLSALFAGATGYYVQYAEQYAEPLMYGRSALTKFLDSWHTLDPYANVYDPNTVWVPGNYPSMGYNYGNINNSTKAVLDASYLRIKTLELGYTLPLSLLNKIHMKNMRVYVNSYNLFTWTGLEGSDPEHPGQIPNAGFEYGLGGYKYPLNRTFNVGASVTF